MAWTASSSRSPTTSGTVAWLGPIVTTKACSSRAPSESIAATVTTMSPKSQGKPKEPHDPT
jgi:hypothetical protein